MDVLGAYEGKSTLRFHQRMVGFREHFYVGEKVCEKGRKMHFSTMNNLNYANAQAGVVVRFGPIILERKVVELYGGYFKPGLYLPRTGFGDIPSGIEFTSLEYALEILDRELGLR